MPVRITGQAVERLANALISDLTLYNQHKLESGADLTSEVEEGRTLFRARVDSAEHHVYEDALRASPLRAYAAGANVMPAQPRVRAPETPSAPTELARSTNLIWVLLLFGLGLSTAAYAYLRAKGSAP